MKNTNQLNTKASKRKKPVGIYLAGGAWDSWCPACEFESHVGCKDMVGVEIT